MCGSGSTAHHPNLPIPQAQHPRGAGAQDWRWERRGKRLGLARDGQEHGFVQRAVGAAEVGAVLGQGGHGGKELMHGEQTAGGGPGQSRGGLCRVSSRWKKGSRLGGWNAVGAQGSEAGRIRPGSGLHGKSPHGGPGSLGKGGVMSPGWGSIPSMFPAPLPSRQGAKLRQTLATWGSHSNCGAM